ncbi:hypothetical protein SAMN04515618_102116 [Collimonas sp. OK307]|nr:hypothetical protein SAMN04515618_102116 [Collimonas sp. OK307]
MLFLLNGLIQARTENVIWECVMPITHPDSSVHRVRIQIFLGKPINCLSPKPT